MLSFIHLLFLTLTVNGKQAIVLSMTTIIVKFATFRNNMHIILTTNILISKGSLLAYTLSALHVALNEEEPPDREPISIHTQTSAVINTCSCTQERKSFIHIHITRYR